MVADVGQEHVRHAITEQLVEDLKIRHAIHSHKSPRDTHVIILS